MKRLALLLMPILFVVGLIAAGPASASSYQWRVDYGDVQGTIRNAGVASTQSPSWQAESYVYGTGCQDTILRFQSDGNLVMYHRHSDVGACGSWTVYWASNTAGNPYSSLLFQTDGNIVIYRSNGSVAWAAGTNRGTVYWYTATVLAGGCFDDMYRPPQGGSPTMIFRAGPYC